MKIAVVGAGIIGITTAYELTLDGHEVTVYEKNNSVAELSSFATGAALAPSMTQAYSHTDWPKSGTLVRFITNVAMLPPRALVNPSAYRWTLAWSKARSADQFKGDFSANAEMLKRSIARLEEICHDEKIEFEQSLGQLVLVRSEQESKISNAKLATLKEMGVAHTLIDGTELARFEPSLNASNDTASAIYFPNDLVGNCRQFAQLLKDRAAAAGTRFEFNTAVTYVNCTPRVELSLQGTSQAVQFDKVVLCTGEALEGLAAPLKIKIPLMTAHAYSLSAQLREPLNGPRSAVYDAKTRIGITRIGNRIRATGGAQIGHPTIASGKRTQERLYLAIQSSFPGAATLSNSTQFWHASTLVATDSKPVIGETEVPGIYLNVGHGFNGWGMSCGSARLLADELSQQTQPLHTTTFSPKRFKR